MKQLQQTCCEVMMMPFFQNQKQALHDCDAGISSIPHANLAHRFGYRIMGIYTRIPDVIF